MFNLWINKTEKQNMEMNIERSKIMITSDKGHYRVKNKLWKKSRTLNICVITNDGRIEKRQISTMLLNVEINARAPNIIPHTFTK